MAKILIIEDECDIGELYRLSLEAAGHSIVGIYEDPAEALEKAPALPAPDLVILDENLGLRSASSYLLQVREAFKNARILLVSANQEAVGTARARGFDEAQRKPIKIQCLLENISDLLKAREVGPE